MASKCAKINDLRVGRTLYYVRFNRVMKVKVTKREFMTPGTFSTGASVRIHWNEGHWSTYGFAGDMGVSGAKYDRRPCMLYTNKGAAERAMPRVQAWKKEIKDFNDRFNKDMDWDE
jgi:hypothetical protein